MRRSGNEAAVFAAQVYARLNAPRGHARLQQRRRHQARQPRGGVCRLRKAEPLLCPLHANACAVVMGGGVAKAARSVAEHELQIGPIAARVRNLARDAFNYILPRRFGHTFVCNQRAAELEKTSKALPYSSQRLRNSFEQRRFLCNNRCARVKR